MDPAPAELIPENITSLSEGQIIALGITAILVATAYRIAQPAALSWLKAVAFLVREIGGTTAQKVDCVLVAICALWAAGAFFRFDLEDGFAYAPIAAIAILLALLTFLISYRWTLGTPGGRSLIQKQRRADRGGTHQRDRD